MGTHIEARTLEWTKLSIRFTIEPINPLEEDQSYRKGLLGKINGLEKTQ